MTQITQGSIIALCMVAVAFVLIVVGVSSDGWIYISGTNTRTSLDQWAVISSTNSDKVKGRAAYAMCVIATVGAALSVACVSVDVLLQDLKRRKGMMPIALPLVTFIAGLVGGISGMTGSIIHVAWIGSNISEAMGDNYYNPGYSFFLTVIGSILLMTGGAVSFKSKHKGNIVAV